MPVKNMRADVIARGGVALLSVLILSGLTTNADAATKYTVATSQSEKTAVGLAKWDTNVAVSYGNGSWTYKSNGLPASNFYAANYAVPSNPLDVSATDASIVAASSVLRDQNYDYVLPLIPKYSKTVTTTNQGPIGIMLNGAALYNPYEANHSTVATSDNFIATSNGVSASFVDDCDGHPGPGGQYHYHGLPWCLVTYATGGSPSVASVTSTAGTTSPGVSETTPAAKKPILVGFAFDGFGVYDNIAMNGSTIPVSALDACNGIFSVVPGYPHGIYHYVLENVKGARSSIACYHGVVSSSYTQALQGILNNGNTPPPSGAALAKTPATAESLAANKNEDDILRAMLQTSAFANLC